MKLTISRNELIRPLQHVIGAVEKRQTMPALANVLLESTETGFSMTATDLEITLKATVAYTMEEAGKVTLPAKKLLDICKALPESSEISITADESKAVISAGKSRFHLVCLPASDFPTLDDISGDHQITVSQKLLRDLLDKTAFAMANQDVRFYLNGMMFEVTPECIRCVATDGHRLSMAEAPADIKIDASQQIIIPRKGVLELQRLLKDDDESISLTLSNNHLRAATSTVQFTSKLIDGRFPDYKRVLPDQSSNHLIADKATLRTALSRASILSNEKYRGIRLELDKDILRIQAHNSEHEEAQDELEVQYSGPQMEVGFNVQYLLDVLNVIPGQCVEVNLKDSASSALLLDVEGADAKYVIMPMRI